LIDPEYSKIPRLRFARYLCFVWRRVSYYPISKIQLNKNRKYAIVSIHQIPSEYLNLKVRLDESERKSAALLIKENPLLWNPKKLSEKFGVPLYVITETVKLPSRKTISDFRYINGLQKLIPRDEAKAKLLEDWTKVQMSNIPVHKETRKKWRLVGNAELNNDDPVWRVGIDRRIAKAEIAGRKRLKEALLRAKEDKEKKDKEKGGKGADKGKGGGKGGGGKGAAGGKGVAAGGKGGGGGGGGKGKK